jgi:transcriptional antiterminator RfaH
MRVMDRNWYAVYTKPRAEKKLHTNLVDKNITSFLPLRKELKLWSDRKKWIEQPLLPSYIFVQVDASERFDVLNTPGAVRYISFEGRPTAIPDNQIVSLQQLISANPKNIEVDYSFIKRGDRVEVTSGPLRGIAGEVVQLNGRFRILLRFESIQCCVHAEIGLNEIRPLPVQRAHQVASMILQ